MKIRLFASVLAIIALLLLPCFLLGCSRSPLGPDPDASAQENGVFKIIYEGYEGYVADRFIVPDKPLPIAARAGETVEIYFKHSGNSWDGEVCVDIDGQQIYGKYNSEEKIRCFSFEMPAKDVEVRIGVAIP